VIVYAESSAVLAWLLGEDKAGPVRRALTSAERIVTSELTIVECDRVLIRAAAMGEIAEGDAADRRALLANASARWNILRLGSEIVERARQPFPGEPIRTLDALHLASALTIRAAVAGVELLSLDGRVRASGRQLGFTLQPR
jgi:predicted nucleic acid-binding protein